MNRPLATAVVLVVAAVVLTGCSTTPVIPPTSGPLDSAGWQNIVFLGCLALVIVVGLVAAAVREAARARHNAAARVAEANAKQAKTELEARRLGLGGGLVKGAPDGEGS